MTGETLACSIAAAHSRGRMSSVLKIAFARLSSNELCCTANEAEAATRPAATMAISAGRSSETHGQAKSDERQRAEQGNPGAQAENSPATARQENARQTHQENVTGKHAPNYAEPRPERDGQREQAGHFKKSGEVIGTDVKSTGPAAALTVRPDGRPKRHPVAAVTKFSIAPR